MNYRIVTGGGTSGNLQQGVVTVLRLNSPYRPDRRDWPMYYRDARNSSVGFQPARLSLSHSSGDVTLSWPLQPDRATVQDNTNLGSSDWYPLASPAVLSNGQNRLTLAATNSHRLFHLNYP